MCAERSALAGAIGSWTQLGHGTQYDIQNQKCERKSVKWCGGHCPALTHAHTCCDSYSPRHMLLARCPPHQFVSDFVLHMDWDNF